MITHTREFQTGLTVCGLNAVRVKCAKPGDPLPTCPKCLESEQARIRDVEACNDQKP